MKSIITEEMRYRQKLCEYARKHVLTAKTRVRIILDYPFSLRLLS
jgi:hypothetical protein